MARGCAKIAVIVNDRLVRRHCGLSCNGKVKHENGIGTEGIDAPLLRGTIAPRKPFVLPGSVAGIGSLPYTSTAAASQAGAEFSPEIPFWPQLPQLSLEEEAIGQGLGVLRGLITPRHYGYGYSVKDGRIDSVLERLHRSDGELMAANASGFGALEEVICTGLFFPSATAVKGQIEGPGHSGDLSFLQRSSVSVRFGVVRSHRLSRFADDDLLGRWIA